MKVAFIGNMNNNHFAMMRYFRDMGVDAFLFKYANELAHFQPECDTWEYEKWAPYIIQTNIVNGDFRQFLKLRPKDLYELYTGYDFYIGNGFAPAYFHKAGLKLDLFLPYSVGIEFTFRGLSKGIINRTKEKIVSYIQVRGILNNVKQLGSSDFDTYNKALSLGISALKLSIPMVYNNSSVNIISDKTCEIIKKINSYDFKIFSHVSHFPYDSLSYKIKRNEVLIKAFAKYIKANPSHNSVLILLEYGKNVEGSKKMIFDLGISNKVMWLPKLERKEIMSIIDHIDLGAGEFGGYFWGGTGWEFLSKGKLFFQYVNLTNEQIEEMIQMPIPKFVNSNNIDLISESIAYYFNNRKELEQLSSSILDWFDKNAGLSLAKKYLMLLREYQSIKNS